MDDTENNQTVEYVYNETSGNITAIKTYSLCDKDAELGIPVSIKNFAYAQSGWTDQLTCVDGNALTYDALGNLLTYNGYTYTWETGRRLTQITNGINTYSYKYDDNGIRTQKTVNSTTTYYTTVDGKITGQYDGTNTIYFRYNADNSLIGFNLNGTEYIYLKNIQGDIEGILDETGTLVVKYTYDAWGKVLSVTGSMADTVGTINPMRYRDYYLDSETGYYYLQSRYYNPEFCRFINADEPCIVLFSDSSAVETNLFGYSNNNPVNNIDPNGHFTIKIYAIAAVTAAIIAAVAKIVSNYLNGLRGYKLFRGVLGSAIGSSVNVVLLMRLIKWGYKGMLLAAFAAGAVQAVFDFAEDLLVYKKASWKKLTYNFILNSAATFAGNYLGGRAVYINGSWIQPKYIKSFFLKSYGKKLLAQTGIGSVLNVIIDLVRSGLKKVKV